MSTVDVPGPPEDRRFSVPESEQDRPIADDPGPATAAAMSPAELSLIHI